MKYNKGMRLKCIKSICGLPVGTIFEVATVYTEEQEIIISLKQIVTNEKDDVIRTVDISEDVISKYFEPIVPKKLIPNFKGTLFAKIDQLINAAQIDTHISFDKTLIVSCKLPNGFVITESVSKVISGKINEYDRKEMFDLCLQKIRTRIFELEAYLITSKEYLERCN